MIRQFSEINNLLYVLLCFFLLQIVLSYSVPNLVSAYGLLSRLIRRQIKISFNVSIVSISVVYCPLES